METLAVYNMSMLSYDISKAALNMLTKLYATEYCEEGFIFIPIHPGYVKTDMSLDGVVTVEHNVLSILEIMLNATQSDNGLFKSMDGQEYGW